MENSAHLPDGDTRRAFVNEKLCHGAANTCAEGFGFAFAKCFGHVVLELPGLNAKCLAEEGQGIGFNVLMHFHAIDTWRIAANVFRIFRKFR